MPHFELSIGEDGRGTYRAEELVTSPGQTGPAAAGLPPTHVERSITISPATSAKIFETARAQKLFQVPCASKAKHIADTGMKTLTYQGADGTGSCVYNYTEIKTIAALTDTMLGIAQTLDEGRILEFKRRYDHLGLDAELGSLSKQNEEGRAIELGTISSLLEQLAGDPEMMDRVRSRATRLLELAGNGR